MQRGLTKLIRRVSDGDQEAYNHFYEAARPLVRGVLMRLLGNEDLEPIEQEVSLELWQRALQFDRAKAPAAAWVIMVARSRALDHLRARRSRKKLETAVRQDAVEGTEDSGITALLFQNELQSQMKTCLETLPDQQRSLIDMCFYGGLSHREVAESLGIPLGTVKTRIRSALMQLAEAMEPVE